MMKSLKNMLRQEKEAYKVPKSVHDYIPITGIFEDGIFKVGNRYTKTFKFEAQRGSDLILAPLLTQGLKVKKVSDDRETPAGVYFMKNGKVRPATTVKHLRSGKGPQTFLTLVMPVRQRTCPVTALEESGDSAVIRFEDGRALRVTLPEAVGGRLRTEWIEGK